MRIEIINKEERKKQQDTDLQEANDIATPVEVPAEPLIVENQPEATLPIDPTETPMPDAGPVATDRELPADTEQLTPTADDEWGAPSKKKKGKCGEKFRGEVAVFHRGREKF
jgi:hypothetical protein